MTDVKNAFASLDHNLLLGMMASFGASEQVPIIINQYLKKSSQFVEKLMDPLKWYGSANLSPAMEKTEVLPLGVPLEGIEIGEVNIMPSKSINFLGVTLQANGNFHMMLNEKASKV